MKKMPVFQEAANKNGLPDKTYKDKMTLLKGKDSIDLYYFGPRAHQRRCVRRVPQPARDARRRCVCQQGTAAHRRDNGGSGVGVSRDAREGGQGHQERGHGHQRPHHR